MLNITAISTAKQKTLAFFCLQPDVKFHEREVARTVALSAGSIHRVVKILEKEEFLVSEKKGKMIFYQLNQERPLIRQYKMAAVVFALETPVFKLRKITDLVILYGSSVSGDFLSGSDVDLLIITSHEKKVQDVLFRFADDFTKEISPVITSLAEWRDYMESNPVFYNQVSKGIVLYKSPYYESEI